MARTALALCLLGLACLARANAFSLPVKGGGGCTGFQYTIKKDEYSYNATMGEVVLGDGCSSEDFYVSKLYIPGSCANTRKNNFGFSSLNPKNIGCDTVDNYSEKTCNLVMQKAPRASILTNRTQGEYVDYGNICWPADVGFIFVQNRCANDIKVAINVQIKSYEGGTCEVIKIGNFRGVGLGAGQIAGIVIAIVVVIIFIALLLYCCCCQLRKA